MGRVSAVHPAVWEGRGFKESLSLVIAVSRQRLVPTVLLFLALYVVVSVIGMVVFGALLPGYFFMTGLATSILGVGMTGDWLGRHHRPHERLWRRL